MRILFIVAALEYFFFDFVECSTKRFFPHVRGHVAVMALALRVVLSIWVRAFVRQFILAESVVTVVAHALCKVLQVGVLATSDQSRFPARFSLNLFKKF